MSKLYAKMSAIMAGLGRLQKDGKIAVFNGYEYATKDAVYDALRHKMGEAQIAIFPQITGYQQQEIVLIKNGKNGEYEQRGYHTIIEMVITLADGETGDTMSCSWVGESTDYGDKSVNQAVSLAMKYFLLSTFMMSTGDDPEAAGSVSHNHSRNTPNTKQSPPPPPAPTQHTTEETIQASVLPIKGNPKKNMILVQGVAVFTREPFRLLGYDDAVIDALGEHGDTVLPDPVVMSYVEEEKADGTMYRAGRYMKRVKTDAVVNLENNTISRKGNA